MKLQHTLSLLALAICGVASTSALAQTGTITINGEITADSCTANITSSGGSSSGAGNFTVQLDPVSYGIFTAADVVAGEKEFIFDLTGCTVSGTKTQMWAHFTGANVDANGRLVTTGAAPMTFELIDGLGGAAIKAGGSASGGPGADQGSGATFTGTNPNKTASKKYAVRYHSEAALASTDSGTLSSSVTYNIQYY